MTRVDESHFTGIAGSRKRNGWKDGVFRRLQKTLGREGTDVTWRGISFQTRAAATGKARSPTVDNRVRRTISDDDDAERRRPRASRSKE